jgi:hypothetical protein
VTVRAPRLLRAALLAGALVVVASSCGDRTPLGVSPQQDLLGSLVQTTSKTIQSLNLLRCDPMPSVSVSQWVGPDGGTIQIGPHQLSIPANALSQWVQITATAPSDTVNHVHFEPEGLQFKKSASLTLSYANCSVVGSLLPKQIVYTTDDLLTILDVLKSLDDPLSQQVTGKLNHFSEYAVAW